MSLTSEEKQRVRYHLGYPSVQSAAGLSFGIARPIQTLFLVESAMNLLLPEAENEVRRIVGVMDGVECRLIEAQDRLAAKQIDQLTLRDNEPGQLELEYQRWGFRLADTLGVPVYAYSTKYRREGKAFAGSIPVSG
jgi:hypothetical protein